MQLVTKSYLLPKTSNYRPQGSFRTTTLDRSRFWSALARRLTNWTCQPASAKHYEDFMMFFTSVLYATTRPMDSTTKCHQLKLMVKNNTKSKLSRSIRSFMGRCNIWSNGSGMMTPRTYGLPPVNWTRQKRLWKPTKDKIS